MYLVATSNQYERASLLPEVATNFFYEVNWLFLTRFVSKYVHV